MKNVKLEHFQRDRVRLLSGAESPVEVGKLKSLIASIIIVI